MADSLLFDGADDERLFSNGQIAGAGNVSVGIILKPAPSPADFDTYFTWNGNVDAGGLQLEAIAGVQRVGCWDGSSYRTGMNLPAADEWYLIGFSKASGISTPRYHVYRYSTSSWTHGNYNGTLNGFSTCTSVRWGLSTSEAFAGNILIGAVWESDVADGTWETLAFLKSAWTAASPDEAWRFDTTGTISPFVGTSTQTGSVGATLDSGDVPAGWLDVVASPVTPNYRLFPKPKLRRS